MKAEKQALRIKIFLGTVFPLLFIFFLILHPQNPLSSFSKKRTFINCKECHNVTLDHNHNLACLQCHKASKAILSQDLVHPEVLRFPASPKNMNRTCGRCHPQEVERLKSSLHFTLAGIVNQVRRLFDLPPLKRALDLPSHYKISKIDGLVSDLLRRRCLRCHIFYRGDEYLETRRGVGCAACHLFFAEGHMQSHIFLKTPPDRLCLHCHYSNRVGWDYYGLFEHDYPYQFRSPFIHGHFPSRPWGVEFHELTPDIHLLKGMNCMACHKKEEIMGDGKSYSQEHAAIKISCKDCHKELPPSPYHKEAVIAQTRCSVCHALWSFQDKGWHLILYINPDWDDWTDLSVQGSSEIEESILEYLQTGHAQAQMTDKFTGGSKPGVWFLAFGWRRFEEIPWGKDYEGKLSVLRPILDLYISFVNKKEDVVFDSYRPLLLKKDPSKAYLPYAPHTIGKADIFRSRKVLKYLGLLKLLQAK